MPYGLTGAPTTFQAIMNFILAPLLRKCVVVFIDDIFIYSSNYSDHLKHVEQVFQLLQQHQFEVKLSKCSFAKQQLHYLGHVLSPNGVANDASKVAIVQKWPSPTSVKELRSFLGLAGYYRRFVRNFGLIARPLNDLLNKGVGFINPRFLMDRLPSKGLAQQTMSRTTRNSWANPKLPERQARRAIHLSDRKAWPRRNNAHF